MSNHKYIFFSDVHDTGTEYENFKDTSKINVGGYCSLISNELDSAYHNRWWIRNTGGSWLEVPVSDVPKEMLLSKLLQGY